MEVVDMKRGTFNAIKDHQQIEKYKCENTYTIYIKNTDDISYVDGITAHNSFKVRIDPIGKEHIKNAKVKLKSLRLPVLTAAAANFKGDVFVRSSIGRNTVVNGGLTAGIIGSAYIKESVRNELFTTHPIETFPGLPDYADLTGALVEIAATNKGMVRKQADNELLNVGTATGYNDDFQLPISDVNKVGDLISRSISKGCIGICADTEILCENPFGKDIQFDILTNDISSLQEVGTDSGDGTTIVLEVQLLPDNQANDRFTN
tara:strand:+ start:7331 stop:8116 length:786 start_codon:yes stop_codon:yes gene_type:complete